MLHRFGKENEFELSGLSHYSNTPKLFQGKMLVSAVKLIFPRDLPSERKQNTPTPYYSDLFWHIEACKKNPTMFHVADVTVHVNHLNFYTDFKFTGIGS